jgi:hypothetical protein
MRTYPAFVSEFNWHYCDKNISLLQYLMRKYMTFFLDSKIVSLNRIHFIGMLRQRMSLIFPIFSLPGQVKFTISALTYYFRINCFNKIKNAPEKPKGWTIR